MLRLDLFAVLFEGLSLRACLRDWTTLCFFVLDLDFLAMSLF